MPRYTFSIRILARQTLVDLEVNDQGALLSVKDRFRDLPAAAQRLMLGDSGPVFYRTLDLYLDLLQYAAPLWYYGLSTPDDFKDLTHCTPKQLRSTKLPASAIAWVRRISQTFDFHGPHWYHVAHVLTQILSDLSKPATDWTQIVYLLQAGGPFFEPVIIRLLPEVKEPGLRSRLLNALLFFPSARVETVTAALLPELPYTTSVGTLSLVSTLRNFRFPEARAFRQGFADYAAKAAPSELPVTGLTAGGKRVTAAAWRQLGEQEYTNQAAIRYLLAQSETDINQLVEACHRCRDWPELLGRFRQEFLAAGYAGDLVPDLDEYVSTNLDRYKWPTGERHHNRIDPEIRHALFQQELKPQTIALLQERLHDKDEFRRDNAAMHLAAYCQLPRIMVRRNGEGTIEAYYQTAPNVRPPLPAEIVARLLSLTVTDHRVTAYHFAARAVAQLALDPVHGTGITDYLLQRAVNDTTGTDLVFCTYLLLPTYHLQPRKAEINKLLPRVIEVIGLRERAAFGRLLCSLHDPELTHAFLRKIAPEQLDATYAMFEELAQAINLLQDDHHALPLPVFHPAFGQQLART